LKELGVLVFIIEVFDDSDKFDPNAEVVNLFVLVERDGDLSFYVFTVLSKGIH